jgi:mRNA interferase MazF
MNTIINDLKRDITRNVTRGSIWLVNFGSSNGSRIQGAIRPALIISNERCNEVSPVLTVVALTSNVMKANMKRMPTHVFISKECGLEVDSIALCEQPRSIDKVQLLSYICDVRDETMVQIEEAVKIQLGMQVKQMSNQLNNQNKIEKIEPMNYEYLKELIISINQLNILQKQTSKLIHAKKILLETFIDYCKKHNQDHKIVFAQIKTMFSKKIEVEQEINVYDDCNCNVGNINYNYCQI